MCRVVLDGALSRWRDLATTIEATTQEQLAYTHIAFSLAINEYLNCFK